MKKIFKTDYTVENLDQQNDIPLGNQTGQDCAGCGSRIAISIRNPGMEGIESALDAETDGDQTDNQ